MKPFPLDYLEDKAAGGEEFTQAELRYALSVLRYGAPREIARMAVCLTSMEKPYVDAVISVAPICSPEAKKILVPLLASTDFVESYGFLFQLLKDSQDEELRALIILCLGKTHYFIFPLLLAHLNDDNVRFREDVEQILAMQDFDLIKPYLALFPSIPNERIFRRIFGDTRIDNLYRH